MLHKIRTEQFLNCQNNDAWQFISTPHNLAKITPEYMGFNILGDTEDQKMFPGQIIEYHVSPLFGIKLHWVTEITHVKEGEYFVDEQRFGPYTFWHHKHFLQKKNNGVNMIDLIHYKMPLGIFGKMANSFLIKKQLENIFKYRQQQLEKIFNT